MIGIDDVLAWFRHNKQFLSDERLIQIKTEIDEELEGRAEQEKMTDKLNEEMDDRINHKDKGVESE